MRKIHTTVGSVGIKSDQGELNIRTRGLLYFKKKKYIYIYIHTSALRSQ